MPTEVASRLVNQETTVQFESIPTYGESLRHSCHSEYFAAVRTYARLDEGSDRCRDWNLEHCRSSAWFFRHVETGEVRVGSNSCHLRWCPVCAQARTNYITHSVSEWLAASGYPKFMTLTLRHSTSPLEHQIKWLYKSFRDLRRRKEFKRCVKGGIWFFQIKKSKSDNLWHPHLHCLIEGLFFQKRLLTRIWGEITHGSTIVDIRPVRDPRKVANDAARYAACPGQLSALEQDDACELVDAVHGKRICGTWGTGRAVSLRPAKSTDSEKWHMLGSWDEVFADRDTNPNARAIINAWKDKKPLDKGLYLRPVERHIKHIERTLWDDCFLDEVPNQERSPP